MNYLNMSWEQYFILRKRNSNDVGTYEYTDKEVVALPKNLQQPPGYRVCFRECTKLIDISPLRNWDARKLTSLNGLFCNCHSLSDISPLSNWKTHNITDMGWAFTHCCNLVDISPLSNWDVTGVTDMTEMLYGCGIYDITPIAKWNLNADVESVNFVTVNIREAYEGGFRSTGSIDIDDYGGFQFVLQHQMAHEKSIHVDKLSLALEVSSLTIPARSSVAIQTEPPRGLLSRLFGL